MMLAQVKQRINSFGIELDPSDDMTLAFVIDKVNHHVKNQTNLNEVPPGLHEIVIDMVVGDFLFTKKSMGLLVVDSLNFDLIEKRIQDGDTTVEYVVDINSTPEANFERLLMSLKHNEADFLRYRVLLW